MRFAVKVLWTIHRLRIRVKMAWKKTRKHAAFVLGVLFVAVISWVLLLLFFDAAAEQPDQQRARGVPLTDYEEWARKYEDWIEEHPGEIPQEYEGREGTFRSFEAQYRLYRTLTPSVD